jgi:hypothetical protein
MSKLNTIAAQLKSAAKSLLDEIAGIDKEIELLHNKRHAITCGHVSKEDYLFYVEAHFKNKGDIFKSQLVANFKKNTVLDFGGLERQYNNKDSFLGMTFLTPYNMPVDISENALYFYFGDRFIDRIKDALDALNWPNDCMPIELRRKELVIIEAQTAELMKKRDEIVKALDEAGLSR